MGSDFFSPFFKTTCGCLKGKIKRDKSEKEENLKSNSNN
jgi:hypothetical protein